MTKRIIVTACTVVAFFSATVPAFAQSAAPTQGGGFFSGISHFFSRMFHPDSAQTSTEVESARDGASHSGMMPMVSGQPDRMFMERMRLDGLVKAGKITSAQETAILAELAKVQTELKTWAASQGINEAIVLGGGLGPMTGEGTERSDGMMQRTNVTGTITPPQGFMHGGPYRPQNQR